MSMKTETIKAAAWFSDPDQRHRSGNLADDLAFTRTDQDMTGMGWVKVGLATITVDMFDLETITNAQINTLKEAKRRIQAEAEARITKIDGQIQSLLALPMEV